MVLLETSTSNHVKENNMINELVKTGKFTEVEAKEFVLKSMQNGADVTQLPKPNSQYR